MTHEEIKERVANYYNAVRSMDANAWVSNFDEEGILEDPVGSPLISGGREVLSQFFSNVVKTMFKKFDIREQAVFAVQDGAAVKWLCEAISHDETEITFEGISIFEYNESGLIKSMKAYWEPEILMDKLQGSSR
jgi:steroid delta-isomerase